MDLALRSYSVGYPDAYSVDGHAHPWGQLVYAETGAVLVAAGGEEFLVPPARAVWLPPGLEHRLVMRGRVFLRCLYLTPELSASLGRACCGLETPPLLRELIVHIAKEGVLYAADPRTAPLIAVLLDRLMAARALPLQLKAPKDPRAMRVAALIRKDPAQALSTSVLAREAGASVRTLQRLFAAETGLRLSEWRRTARLLHATALLLEGSSVTEAGLASGYGSPSAFTSAYRKGSGRTPLAVRKTR
jgi:AraC-like DNA-binding protein